MAQYMPPTAQQQPPGASRSRATSRASIKYHPDNPRNLQPPTPQPSAPMPIPAYVQQGGPTFAGQPFLGTPPVANAAYFGTPPGQSMGVTPPVNANYYGSSPGYFGTSPGRLHPQTQLHPGYPVMPNSGPPTSQSQPYTPPGVANRNYAGPSFVDQDGYMRPPRDTRRASATSTHSHRSGRSDRSHRSHHSSGRRDSQRPAPRRHSEVPRYSDDNDDSDDEGERRRRHSEGGERKPKPPKPHRPTWGDTVYGMFGIIKDALGPRDKY
ncbi:hypothetical protein LTR09_011180 [Extremus antarcticus]|uniref:Uncharacterized protein n=1 Tax=Extremus antarcticus TaxID=702011 RepID=A0AAJ0D6R8_9PEZI|nr:hypothetical protein LTR09_011180 [Extremus antarcticus]